MITPCDKYKDLGIIVSEDLKASEQVGKCVMKANSMVGMIRRTFTHVNKDILLRTYKVFVRPILEYCQQVWSPYLKKYIDEIENVQRRATKLIPELQDLSYEERLTALDLYKLSERRQRGDMIFLYKVFHGLVDLEPHNLFDLNMDGKTRGHHLKIRQKRIDSDMRRHFYTQIVVVPWNNLPQHIILSENVTVFKRNYDKYILKQALD